MFGFLRLWPLAVRRARSRWRLLLPLLAGAVLAVGLLSSTFIYVDAVRQLGLDRTFAQRERHELDLDLVNYYAPSGDAAYTTIRAEMDLAIFRNIQWFVEGSSRGIESSTFFVNDVAPAGASIDDSPLQIEGEEEDKIDPRLRAFVYFQEDFYDHTDLVAGVLPEEVRVAVDEDGRPTSHPVIGTVILKETADAKGLSLGDQLLLSPHWDDASTHVIARVDGIVRRKDAGDRFWHSELQEYVAESQPDRFVPLLVSEDTYVLGLSNLFPAMLTDYSWALFIDPTRIDVGNVDLAQAGLLRLSSQLRSRPISFYQTGTLNQALDEFDTKDLFGRVPLLIVVLMIMGIVTYYLVMVSNVLVDRHLGEMALLQSRGADGSQVLALYLWEAIGIAAVAFIVGPFLAVGATTLMGLTPTFSDISDGTLPVKLSPSAVGMALAGAAIALGAMLLPTLRASGLSLLRHRAGMARPPSASFFHKYYVDVFLGIIAGLLYWELTQRSSVVSDTFLGDEDVDQLLLAAPALFLLAIGLLLLRFFPLGMGALGWAASSFRRAWLVLGLWQMARNPLPYTRPILLLMLAASVTMFAANFGQTLNRSYEDRAQYASGGDVLFRNAALARSGDSVSFEDAFVDLDGASAATPAFRGRAFRALQLFSSTRFDLLAVDPETFGDVAFFRDDFANTSLDGLMGTLALDQSEGLGVTLPPDAVSLGVWARPTSARRDLEVRARVRDANDRYRSVPLGRLDPGTWQFLESPLEAPPGFRGRTFSLSPPITVVSLTVRQRSGLTLRAGAVYLDDLTATKASGETVVLESFDSAGAIGVIQDTPTASGDSFEVSASQVRVDGDPTGVFIWGPGSIASSRGLYLGDASAVRDQPLRAIASRSALAEDGFSRGDVVNLSVSGHIVPVTIAEVVDFFPTLNPFERGFMVLSLPALQDRVNAPEAGTDWQPTEIWVSTDLQGSAREAFIRDAEANLGLRSTDSVALLQSFEADPLIAAGWRGALNIAFFAVVFATLLGFGVYAYAQAQQRRVEFALLRGMGISRLGLAAVICIEQLIVVALGLGLGSWIGVQLTSILMPFLDLTEEGSRVLPPFVAEVNWTAISVTYSVIGAVVLGATLGLVGFFSRFGIQRALRIGEA